MSAATSSAVEATLLVGRTLKRLLPPSRPLALNLARAAQIMILSRQLQRQSAPPATASSRMSLRLDVNKSVAVARLQARAKESHDGLYQRLDARTGLAICALAGTAAAALTPTTECESLQDYEDTSESASPSYANEDVSAGFEDVFEMRNLLGAGAFGVVMLCRHKASGDDFAVKIVQDLPNHVAEIRREQEALARIEQHGGHPNIVAYDRSYDEGGFHYLVMENLRGDSLFSFMKKRHALDVSSALQLVAQLADALVFMSSVDLIHRDLKPENVMVTVPGRSEDVAMADPGDIVLKIIDFGSAGKVSRPEASSSGRPVLLSGTRTYWSPEVLEQQSMTAAMDAWAIGCILYILLSGRHPFDLMGCSTEEQILRRIRSDQASFLLPEWDAVPEDVKELVRGLLDKDPAQRLTPKDILAHPAVIAAVSNAGDATE
jgi:serine/threonine protein kinase